jgi:uncharacterized protein YggE
LGGTQNTISVSGEADMDVSPDLAVLSWSTQADGKTVEEAQAKVTEIGNKAMAYLKGKGIPTADLKTSINTETKYQTSYRPCTASDAMPERSVGSGGSVAPSIAPVPPCGGESVAVGYTVYEYGEVKIRNINKETNKAGELVAGLSQIGVKTNGPTNTIDNPDVYKNAVRGEAIAKARQQAEVLAAQLGVKLVRVASFNENNYQPYPMYAAMGSAKSLDSAAPVAPDLSAGTNKITSTVNITYEIR